MFKLEYCRTLAEVTEQQIRAAFQGYGGTGKTTAAMTFPNPAAANIDRGLITFQGRADILEIPFWEFEFCKKINPGHKGPADTRDTILIWLNKHAPKLEADQTLVWDGGSGTQAMHHRWYESNKIYTKRGEHDDFAVWRTKIEFFTTLFETFKTLKCHVIFICHETDKKDKDGSYSGKIRPLISGQMGDQMMKEFTDWYRQQCKQKPDISKVTDKDLKDWGCKSKEEFQKILDMFKTDTIYYWQTQGDDIFDAKCSLVDAPKYLPATYESFKQYQRKLTQ